MNYTVMEQYWIWLSSIEGIGPKRFYQLLSIFEDARTVWDALANPNNLSSLKFLPGNVLNNLKEARNENYFYRLFDKMDRLNIRAVTRLSKDYPQPLNNIYDPPCTLYIRGECPLHDERMFAIVGSRRSTRDGEKAAREIAEALAQENAVIVSGMARGIDTFAHQGALAGGGRTIAVLGCGVDIVYPPENDRLMNQILENGGAVISEYIPGTQPSARNFPARNRIISGMTPGVLLVEGAKGSGAMITVNFALEQGKDVFAIPGSIYSPLSAMPNRLIIEGATPVVSPWEILEFYRWGRRAELKTEAASREIDLDSDEKILVEPLREQELSFDELINISSFSPAKLNSHLTMLELRGIIVKVPGGMYRAYL